MGRYDKENRCILELCKPQGFDSVYIQEAFAGVLDLPYLLGQLLFHRVGGIAYHVLSECDMLPTLNREFRNPLKMIYDASRERTESFLQAENQLAALFASAAFPHAFLKGALLSCIYPVGLRTSNDFDVLINQQDTQSITDLLTSNGFEQGFLRNDVFTPATRSEILYARMNKGETVPFVKRIDLPHMPWLEIDVNFSLDFKAKQGNDTVAQILARTEKNIINDVGALSTLSPVDFLIHLCAHLYKEASTYHWVSIGRDLSLYKFCDIYLMLSLHLNRQFADKLAEVILSFDLQQPCYYTFYYTRGLFGLQNVLLDQLLLQIAPEDTAVLRRVYDPAKKKSFRFQGGYTDYLFCPNRLSCLEEEG